MEVFGDAWVADLMSFRRSPHSFLTSRRISADSLVLDILQILCSERQELVKSCLLGLLQEYPGVLLGDATSLEHTFASLKDMFEQISGNAELLYRSQILVTLTNLAVVFNFLHMEAQLLTGFVDLLLTTTTKVNNIGDSSVRSTACHCLIELEKAYPGLLAAKLGHLFAMASMEQSYVSQDYMVLYVTVLQNVIHMVITDSQWHTEHALHYWLTSRSEALLPYNIPDALPDLKADDQSRLALGTMLASNVDTKELRRALSVVTEHTPFMSAPSLLMTIRKLMNCVRWTGLSPTMFKHHLLRYLASYSLPHFHLALLLKMKFPTGFLEEEEEDLLLHRLLIHADHHDLPTEQRLMCFHWLRHYPSETLSQTVIPSDDCMMSSLGTVERRHLYPLVFDPVPVMRIKLDCFSLLIIAMDQEDSRSAQLLIDLLICLHKPVEYGVCGEVAVAFYRVLFAFYQRHGHTKLGQMAYQLLVETVTMHPPFTPHTVDYLECVRKASPESSLPIKMLQALGEQTVNTPVQRLVGQLPYHLALLKHVACEADINPVPLIIYLQQVLNWSSLCQEGVWSVGNKLLAVCSCILQHHQSSVVFKEMGNLLTLMCNDFNDVDIRDRARLFYCLLTTVSSSKLMHLLTFGSDGTSASQRLTRLVEVGLSAPSFPPAAPLEELPSNLLQLTRVVQEPTSDPAHSDLRHQPVAGIDMDAAMGWYNEQVLASSQQLRVTLPYQLCFNKQNSSKDLPSCLYAVCIQLKTTESFSPVKDVVVTYLTREPAANSSLPCDERECWLEFLPLAPRPATFSVRATYSGKGGDTYATRLADLRLDFADIFLPLPVQADILSKDVAVVNAVRQHTFDRLWQDLSSPSSSANGIQSVVSLKQGKGELWPCLHKHFLPYIVLETDEVIEVGIALPPHHTLLIRFLPNVPHVVASLVTDVWDALPLVESYLHDLSKDSQANQ